nr:hypothetical protein [Cylindrospermopsis raciborskii]
MVIRQLTRRLGELSEQRLGQIRQWLSGVRTS